MIWMQNRSLWSYNVTCCWTDLCEVTMSPAVENTRSLGTEVLWMHSIVLANSLWKHSINVPRLIWSSVVMIESEKSWKHVSICELESYDYKNTVWLKQKKVKRPTHTMDLSLARCVCSLTKAYQVLAYGCITIRQYVVYILHLSMTSTFELNVVDWGYP